MGIVKPTKFSDDTDGITLTTFQADIFEADEDKFAIRGLALPFAETYESPFADISFSEDAFDETLEKLNDKTDSAFLAADGHTLDAMYLLAKSDISEGEGSLRFYLSDEGLCFEAEMVRDFVGEAIYKRIELGILDGVSIGITLDDFDDEYDEDTDRYTFVYNNVGLREVSLVSEPAFSGTWVDTKEMADFKDEIDEMDSPTDVLMGKVDALYADIDEKMEQVRKLMNIVDEKLDFMSDTSKEVERDNYEDEEDANSPFASLYRYNKEV